MHGLNIVLCDEGDLERFETSAYDKSCGEITEADFLTAHRALLGSLQSVISVVESGDAGEADLAMCEWVEPTRVLVVVVRRASKRLSSFVSVAFKFLEQFPRHAILLDDYPVQLVFLPSQKVLVPKSVPTEYLEMLFRHDKHSPSVEDVS